jgi:hypothetical protein
MKTDPSLANSAAELLRAVRVLAVFFVSVAAAIVVAAVVIKVREWRRNN